MQPCRYSSKNVRRYAYYETRKDLARPSDPPASRFRQGMFDQHIIEQLVSLLGDEHALRRLTGFEGADQLRSLFAAARAMRDSLHNIADAKPAIHSLVALIKVQPKGLELTLKPAALGLPECACWTWSIPQPARKPFREAKLRIDPDETGRIVDVQEVARQGQLVSLLADAAEVNNLVLASPNLTLNQLARREGRCRKQLHKLLRLSWLSPRIVEAVISGTQPEGLTRARLFDADLPIDWAEQEHLLGL